MNRPWHRSQVEVATLFFVHCIEYFLGPGGRIGFVMPRSVITGARQHQNFQAQTPIEAIVDLQAVQPLFNVPACVLISGKDAPTIPSVPVTIIQGSLPRRNATASEAESCLARTTGEFSPLVGASQSSPYLEEVFQGAILIPRNFWYVRLHSGALVIDHERPHVETDPEIDADAKPPWKGLRLEGPVERQFLFGSLLTEDLVPFGVRRLRLIVLPIAEAERSFGGASPPATHRVLGIPAASARGLVGLTGWLQQAAALWITHKRENADADIVHRIDFQHNLTRQAPKAGWKVLFNSSGTSLAAVALDAATVREIGGLGIASLVINEKLYCFATDSQDEAMYVAAFLNAPIVDALIKPYQSRGQFGATRGGGERDIHRRAFELAPLPRFDPMNPLHTRLAVVAADAHGLVRSVPISMSGPVGRVRSRVRESLQPQLTEIDELVQQILDQHGAAAEGAQPALIDVLGSG
jgi:hypothetical protein